MHWCVLNQSLRTQASKRVHRPMHVCNNTSNFRRYPFNYRHVYIAALEGYDLEGYVIGIIPLKYFEGIIVLFTE
jgi:hypothetical protein